MTNVRHTVPRDYQHAPMSTPYQAVGQQWDKPIGAPVTAAAMWRLGFIITIMLNIILAILLILQASAPKAHLLAATITPAGHTINIGTLPLQPRG